MSNPEYGKQSTDPYDFEQLLDLIKVVEDMAKDLMKYKDFSEEFWNLWKIHVRSRRSPVQLAVLKGHLGIVRYLLERGIDYLNDMYVSPLVEAVKCGHLEIVRALVDEFEYDVSEVQNADNLVNIAMRNEDFELVKYLVDNGADTSHTGRKRGVLHAFVNLHDEGMCEFILSRGFHQINARNARGQTAFFRAYLSGYLSICDILVKYGADVNMGSLKNPNIFLHATRMDRHATCSGELDTINRLLIYQTDPDMDTPSKEKPIEWAVRKFKYIIVHYLAVVLNVPLNRLIIQKSLGKRLTIVPENERLDHLSTKILLLKAGLHIGPKQYKSLSKDVESLQPGEASKSDVFLVNPFLGELIAFLSQRN